MHMLAMLMCFKNRTVKCLTTLADYKLNCMCSAVYVGFVAHGHLNLPDEAQNLPEPGTSRAACHVRQSSSLVNSMASTTRAFGMARF